MVFRKQKNSRAYRKGSFLYGVTSFFIFSLLYFPSIIYNNIMLYFLFGFVIMETELKEILENVNEIKQKYENIKKDIEALNNLIKNSKDINQNIKEFAENIRRQLISLLQQIWNIEDTLYQNFDRTISIYDLLYSNEKYNCCRIEFIRDYDSCINLIKSLLQNTDIFDDLLTCNIEDLEALEENDDYYTYFDLHFSIKVNELRIVKITYIIEERELYIDIVPIEEFLKELEDDIDSIKEFLVEEMLEEL